MSRRLPPLNALRAFEVAARTTSFTAAAQELHVSQGAVSRHVAQLETFLGTKLFHRNHRDVTLTPGGVKYAQAIRIAFDRVDEATHSLLHAGRQRALRIKLFPTMAINWFVPRLARFHDRHRDIDLQITTTANPVRFDAEDVDFSIQIPYIPQPGVRYDKLFDIELLPVCSRDFIERAPTFRRPEDLLQRTLLHSMKRPSDWRLWFAAAGINPSAIRDGLTFGNSALAYQAAIDGSGIAIAHLPIVHDDLASGRLLAASEIRVSTGESYNLVGRDTCDADARAVAFRAWVLAEAMECTMPREPDQARNAPRQLRQITS
jgi:LysR family transcriptional regulator, glycine cleavage system transcriptional activator